MKHATPLLWPLLVGAVSLALTAGLWWHERQTQEQSLRSHFGFGLRQAATRIEQRLTSYEQMLRGVRGLFEAADSVTREDFAAYVDSLTAGSDVTGLRTIAYAPLRRDDRRTAVTGMADDGAARSAPLSYAAPVLEPMLQPSAIDLLADPARRAAMLQARDSGRTAITEALRPMPAPLAAPGPEVGFLLFLPLYAPNQPHDTVARRRAHLIGWVLASFRIGDLMSSLYGEVTPGLDVRLHDGVDVNERTLMYPSPAAVGPQPAARFEAQEYLGVAGHTWTLSVRSRPSFEQPGSNDPPRVIALAGSGLSVALSLLTWQLVTARARAQASARAMTRQLRASAEQYRRIVETANEGIWMVDAAARTSFVNPAVQRMLGYDGDELMGRRWVDFMDDTGRAIFGGGLGPLQRGVAEHLEIRFRRKDGTLLWAQLSTSAITDEAGRFAGALAMVTDITDRKLAAASQAQLEDQLRQSQKMEAIGTLAGGIAHDFNNILAAILGNVALIGQDLGAAHPSAGRLAHIRQAGERGRSLVQQIVTFSRQQPPQRVTQPLRPLLEESARLLRSTLPALVELDLRLGDAPLYVSADATQLQQVLMNLCTNAWHAMTGGTGRIEIGLDSVTLDAAAADRLGLLAPGPHAQVWVADDGCGMDETTRKRIFEPFYTTKPVGQGTGLGLSVVHGIVTAHGGAITVDSSPGQGSRFGMYFPLAAAPAPSPMAARPVAEPVLPPARGEHVLVVDDDPVVGIMIESLLQRRGYRVTHVADPRQALDLATAAGQAVDLVVTDFNMPEMSGLHLAQELQRLQPRLPVIITTGYISESLRDEAARAGVQHVLQKERLFERLEALVHQALTAGDRAAEGLDAQSGAMSEEANSGGRPPG